MILNGPYFLSSNFDSGFFSLSFRRNPSVLFERWRQLTKKGLFKTVCIKILQVQACEYCWSIVDSMWLTILGENSKYKVKFDDPRVCKSFLLGCCPHDILSSTVRIYIPTWFWLSQFVRPFGMYMILRGQFQIKYNQKFFDIMIRNVYLLI